MKSWQYDRSAKIYFSFTQLFYLFRNSQNHPPNTFQLWVYQYHGAADFTFSFSSQPYSPLNLVVLAKRKRDFNWTLSQCLCNHYCTVHGRADKRETRALSFVLDFNVSPIGDCLLCSRNSCSTSTSGCYLTPKPGPTTCHCNIEIIPPMHIFLEQLSVHVVDCAAVGTPA